jgi:hypothetical protein
MAGGREVMSDLDKFVALYKEFGIDIKVSKTDTGYSVTLIGERYGHDDAETTSPKFEGYMGFYSLIEFNKDGNFIKQGFWE